MHASFAEGVDGATEELMRDAVLPSREELKCFLVILHRGHHKFIVLVRLRTMFVSLRVILNVIVTASMIVHVTNTTVRLIGYRRCEPEPREVSQTSHRWSELQADTAKKLLHRWSKERTNFWRLLTRLLNWIRDSYVPNNSGQSVNQASSQLASQPASSTQAQSF